MKTKTVKIPLTKEKVAIIDAADEELVGRYAWRAFHSRGNWYAQATLPGLRGPGSTIFMHRLLVDAPKGTQVDHRDHDGLNNRRDNLRYATHATNQMNRRSGVGLSRFKGVSYNARTRMWLSRIVHTKKTGCLGHYVTEEMAALAYDLAAEVLFGEFRSLNLPVSAKSRNAVVRAECLAKLQRLQLVSL